MAYKVKTPATGMPADQAEYLARLRQRLKAAWTIAEQTAAEAYRARTDRMNEDRHAAELSPGQLVWVDRPAAEAVLGPQSSRRLLPRLTGPWRVIRRLPGTSGTYQLQHVVKQKTASFNIDQTVPVAGHEEATADIASPADDDDLGSVIEDSEPPVDGEDHAEDASAGSDEADSPAAKGGPDLNPEPAPDPGDDDEISSGFESYHASDFATTDDDSDQDDGAATYCDGVTEARLRLPGLRPAVLAGKAFESASSVVRRSD
jgi:hypothetical protein